ncbi:hypothetical protein AZE42_08052 [Rhizopogon vesiculosus]|uniref:Uncharacterized protein n=1 Tax=Rhizopogon vesiculosus TaxID=180088 RepID=A0A1J8PTC3_9AGAM|nr:hypothetical protein AZE42_08052 [Rhizopogon vesiculosus]
MGDFSPSLPSQKLQTAASAVPSGNETVSPRESPGLLRKVGKVITGNLRTRNTPSDQSPNPFLAPALVSPSQESSPDPTATPEANPSQATNSGTAEAKLPESVSMNHILITPNIASATVNAESSPNQAKPSDLGPANEKIADPDATGTQRTKQPGVVSSTASATANTESGLNKFSASFEPLNVFISHADKIAQDHPDAKAALSILTYASKMIIESNQADWDDVVADLLKKVSDVYTFMDEDTTMVGIQPMLAIYGKIARQMLECADFIAHYSEIKRTREDNTLQWNGSDLQ